MNVGKYKGKAKIALTVERINRSLWFRVPWKRRQQIVRDLRANLAEASEATGPDAAVKSLGDIRQLVNEYIDAERGRVDVAMGLAAVAGVWAFFFAVMVFAMVIATDAYDASGATGHYVRTYLGTLTIDIDYSGDQRSFSTGLTGVGGFAVTWIAFLVGSKSWRLIPAFNRKASV